MRKYRKWKDILIEQLAADREEAIGFLQAVMEDYQVFRNPAAVVSAVQAVIESQGGIEEVAKRAAMSPETLSKILSSEKSPHLDTLAAVFNALGCRLAIVPLKTDEHATADTVPVPEVESQKVGDSQTQLIESDSPQ